MFVRKPPSSVALIVSGIDRAVLEAIESGASRWPTLTLLASRGRVRELPDAGALQPWQFGVLDALGQTDAADRFPSAPLVRIGETGQITTECWAQLQCVHFAAGMNEMRGVLLAGNARVTANEQSELTATIAAHLSADGYELVARGCGEWLVRCPRPIQARTLAPDVAFRGPLHRALPNGKDAASLRRLMTEMQMLLHEHPVNAARAQRGVPAVNAIWFWGLGSVAGPSEASIALPSAFGSEAYLKGLYLLHSQAVRELPMPLEDKRSLRASRSLTVVDATELDVLESRWLAPLARALRRGVVEQLAVYLDRWRIDVARRDLLKFWRRALEPRHWPQRAP